MGTNIHQKHLAAAGRQNPPSGRNDDTGTHAMRAGKKGPTQRKSVVHKEPKTRDVGSDDRHSGSEHDKH